MGTWDLKLCSDDVMLDIKNAYILKLKMGKSESDVIEEIFAENLLYFDDDDKYSAWYSLADTMWNYGRLTDEVKDEALELIKYDMERYNEEDDKKENEKKKKMLENLPKKLSTEQPAKKKVM